MKTIQEVLILFQPSLDPILLERYVAENWVRPRQGESGYLFEEIDIARLRLVHELRTELDVGDGAIDIVLSLLDQLYASQRRMRHLSQAISRQEDATRQAIAQAFANATSD